MCAHINAEEVSLIKEGAGRSSLAMQAGQIGQTPTVSNLYLSLRLSLSAFVAKQFERAHHQRNWSLSIVWTDAAHLFAYYMNRREKGE